MLEQPIMLLFLCLWPIAVVALEISQIERIADEANLHRSDPDVGHRPECVGHQFVQLPFIQIDLQRILAADDALVDTIDIPTPKARPPLTTMHIQDQIIPTISSTQGLVAATRIQEDELRAILTDILTQRPAFVQTTAKDVIVDAQMHGETVAGHSQSEGNGSMGEKALGFHDTLETPKLPSAILNFSLLSKLDVVLQAMVDCASEVTPEVRANVSSVVLFTMVGIFVFMVVGAVVFVI